jgi:thymidylate synthase (FAD)
MTTQAEVVNDSNYITVLDHGFVGLVDHVGSDDKICRAARVSYGTGTKSVRENRGLIRYLMRHKHTSPFEMGDVTLHLKLPIFVMRQLVRHRTSSLNEYSARYSVLSDEMYIPNLDNIKPQSKQNNQGRAGEFEGEDAQIIQDIIRTSTENSYAVYQALISEGPSTFEDGEGNDVGFSEDFPGLARELARTVMPVAGYTELYWKQNLHNLFHMLKLREDPHAQWEIQEFARAIYKIVKPLFPAACEAYEDYMRDAISLSGMEKNLLQNVVLLSNNMNISFNSALEQIIGEEGGEAAMLEAYRLSKRELAEFKSNLGL